MEKTKILHLVSSLSKGSGVMGVIMNYYRNMDYNNLEFHFLYFKETEKNYIEEIEKLGGKTYYISPPSIKSYLKYIDFFKRNKGVYKAVHLHEVYLNIVIFPIARVFGINNLIVHSHNTRFSDKRKANIRNKILCVFIKKIANYYFACSKAAGKFLYGKNSMDKVIIMNNAIECDKYRFNMETRINIREELGLQENLVIGNIGRFNEQKNHEFLINIFREILKVNSEAVLLLVGEGPLYREIVEKVTINGLQDKVMFLGVRSDLDRIYQAIDIIIMPSLFEGLPVVGVEAQCAGCKCYMSTEITSEINLTNVEFLNLSDSATQWAKAIYNTNDFMYRKDAYKMIKDKGFDINIESYKIQEFYMNL